jgi:hypothetical protein
MAAGIASKMEIIAPPQIFLMVFCSGPVIVYCHNKTGTAYFLAPTHLSIGT